MNPDIIPVLIIFGAGIFAGVGMAWIVAFTRRMMRWRRLCLPPPLPAPGWADFIEAAKPRTPQPELLPNTLEALHVRQMAVFGQQRSLSFWQEFGR
jgi:hypothetical protein